ncbi:hypothetical protein [Nocardioides perillae]|uniref:Metallo-peptidase family M12B Reprolysin-like n=1 Tax=Nocardioides perillae TaxID=1119534 RepID=A0A7Y9RTS8_9ACTN|nr:hypothetical protein [Nocardioides perillae]NYG56481.1 hypothetical protein [Nocardioides perillae]
MSRALPGPLRRLLPLLVSAVLLAAACAVVGLGFRAVQVAGPSACPSGEWLRLPGAPPACVHADVAPPGVDVTAHVPTHVLAAREGAGERAHEVAEDLGVPTTAEAAVSSPEVACDGDGSAGYRTQAMYVVESDDPNRYADLVASMRVWAAGVDDVVNRSAALTGGVRRVRYVSEPGTTEGTCVPSVLNVTVPPGSLSSFGSAISAVQAQGHTAPSRKYLVWTDASVLCGVASMYLGDREDQANPNNGAYPQYARVDSGCWGLGSLAGQHSVEAHELVHTLGAVSSAAPNGTAAGHCTDEHDTMCYADGAGVTMRFVCPAASGYLLDCGGDDYFSTFPDPGGWLDGHWNAADSRFLVGGGDGTGGGTTGTPSTLGATLAVNNPAVPGLPTQATVTPVLPSGRSLATVVWKATRRDCTFASPGAVSTEVTCSATSATATTVTATVTDSAGSTRSVAVPLTFARPTATRPVTLELTTAGQRVTDFPTASVCAGAPAVVVGTVVDTASSRPVKGLEVAFRKTTATGASSSAGTVTTTHDGAVARLTTRAPLTLVAASLGAHGFGGATAPTQAVTAGTCAPRLTASASAATVWHGDVLTVSGSLVRQVTGPDGPVDVPVAGAVVPVSVTGTTTSATGVERVVVKRLGSAKVALDGSWTLTAKPTTSGALAAALPGSTAYVADRVDLGPLTVRTPVSGLTAAVADGDVGWGTTSVVNGRLTLARDGVVAGLPSATVSATVTPPGGRAVRVGSGRTAADGTWSLPALLKVSGALRVRYAGAAGRPAVEQLVGDVVAGSWTPALAVISAPAAATTGASITVTGTVTRAYDCTSGPATGLRVRLTWTPSGGQAAATLTSAATTSKSTVTLRTRAPAGAGELRLEVVGAPGHLDAASTARPFTGS